MIRKLSVMLSLLCILMSVSFTAFAEVEKCSFALSDVTTKQGRLFTTTLSIKSNEKIASFVGEITFDGSVVEYREVKCSDEKFLVSVNSKDKDKITFVFLCEDGVSCTSRTEILTFKFKANADNIGGINLGVKDVINSNGEDVSSVVHNPLASSVEGSSDKNKDSKNKNNENASDFIGDEEQGTEGNGFTKVMGGEANPFLIGIIIAGVVVALTIVAYIFYKLGANRSKRSSIGDAKESEGNEEKT